MKLTFVHAPEDYYDQNYGTQFFPVWAYCLASFIPRQWDIDIIDCRSENITDCEPAEVFAFGGINQDFNSICEKRDLLKTKFPDALFILGGPITWSFEQEGKLDSLKHFDYLFILDGEEALPFFLQKYEEDNLEQIEQIVRFPRFDVSKSKKIQFEILDRKTLKYYGAVIEVSRGCPFLCEFCDIRVLPGNNQAHNKNIDLIIDEINEHYKRGIGKFQFACDNFIGDPKWANECVDAILEWKERTGANISIFAWLTINLYKMKSLMKKMRKAGFSILFIGIESVNQNSLLETAKVQNMKSLGEAVETIHSFGFIIAPGFIFGFDSDDDKTFQNTLAFINQTGILGGDPSFLVALAGTPLYARMKASDRLVVNQNQGAIERKKIMTNILYLQDKDFLVQGFMEFVKVFTSPKFQYSRLHSNLELIVNSSNFIPNDDSGYATPLSYTLMQIKNREYLSMLMKRILFLLRPDRLWIVFKAWLLVKKYSNRVPNISTNFYYWLYTWTNLKMKYQGLKLDDFQLHTVEKGFDRSKLSLFDLGEQSKKQNRKDGIKVDIQSKYTKQALENL